MVAKRKVKGCISELETHTILTFEGFGCTREEAEADLFRQCLEKADKERKEKCGGLTCGKGSICVTTILGTDVINLAKSVVYFPFLRKDCPRKIAWVARIISDIDDPIKYQSTCTCVPGRKFF